LVVSTKQQVVFHLAGKNTFSFKKIENVYALDSIKSLNLPQILSKKTQQQQAQPSLQHPSKGFGFFKALTPLGLT